MDGRTAPTEANQHVALEINTPWLESIKYRAGMSLNRKPPAKPTILRVPWSMRCGNPGAYEPKLVSIGPYHRGKSEDLKAMEELKWRLLHNYLSKVPNGCENEGLRMMKDLEKQARDCYSEVIDLDSDKFVEMLLLDGCFLIHIFIEDLQAEELRSLLLDNMWCLGLITRDLLLLENQLPYFIVEHLLETLGMSQWDSSRLQKVAIRHFANFLPRSSIHRQDPELTAHGFQSVDHLLHLFHKWILSVPMLEDSSNPRCCNKLPLERICSALSPMVKKTGDCLCKLLPSCSNVPTTTELGLKCVPTMTELAEAGLKIRVREAKIFLDISFNKLKGALEIPPIAVGDFTNLVFANLIALEQVCHANGSRVSEYARFMDCIINTPRDEDLLHQERIIHRWLGDNDDIASLFNQLCTGVFYGSENNYLESVYDDLKDYCQYRWHRWRAKAVHDYFNNPWAIISLGAAVLLLGFTILQSVYCVLDHYKK